ncbi:5'-3' exonuclease PLD3-like [Ptychodera flava]|uniref:5'-3' exonuclease PLD3-like n=1 Tax=Ptychodera flava TaxID=63121 RepID=UPI00396A5685
MMSAADGQKSSPETDPKKPLLINKGSSQDDGVEAVHPQHSCRSLIPMFALIIFIIAAVVGVSLLVYLQRREHQPPPAPPCDDPCLITLVESIPENLTYEKHFTKHMSIYEGWMNLLSIAEQDIDIAAYYWTLRGVDGQSDPSDWQGEDIYAGLLAAGTTRGIKIRIAQSQPSKSEPSNDTIDLAKAGAAEVRSLNFPRFMPTHAGILHTKMWVVDGKHFYVGSANLDWRSLTQVKEVGAIIYNCSCLAKDMTKIFETYWYMGNPKSELPEEWPSSYDTGYNISSPMQLKFNDTDSRTFLANSPPELCPEGRSSDIDTILHVIDSAEKFVSIAVMDYIPAIEYQYPQSYWSVIDDKLRRVAYDKGIHVKILASNWTHTEPEMLNFLRSIAELDRAVKGRIEVKLFTVPAYTEAQKLLEYARVNHNKYMVTDNAAYVGTSNWSGDYFVSTGGIGFVVNQTNPDDHSNDGSPTFQQQLQSVFERDWNSEHSEPIS